MTRGKGILINIELEKSYLFVEWMVVCIYEIIQCEITFKNVRFELACV